MCSPRYRPAGLLVSWGKHRVMLDGGGSAEPDPPIDAWLVCDVRAELMPAIRRRAREGGVPVDVMPYTASNVRLHPMPVRHTSYPSYGYVIEASKRRVVWAPEFWEFPGWAAGADLMFADAAGWNRPIRFRGGVGGHACVRDTAEAARRSGVRRLVFAHIGRPTIRAIERGEMATFGEWGVEGRTYSLP
jgi:ribonuclease BN (tRNA processing enzyme)